MDQFFAANYSGPAFELFGTTHILALVCVVLLNLFLVRFRNAGDTVKGVIRWLLALTLVSNELAWHYWNYINGLWTI